MLFDREKDEKVKRSIAPNYSPGEAGSCRRCKLLHYGNGENCELCGGVLVREKLLLEDWRYPTLQQVKNQKEFDRNLRQKGIGRKQFKVILYTIGKAVVVKHCGKEQGLEDSLKSLIKDNIELSIIALEEIFTRLEEAKTNDELWLKLLKRECSQEMYLHSTHRYKYEQLSADVSLQLLDLEILKGSTGEQKLESLRELYFESYEVFKRALAQIVSRAKRPESIPDWYVDRGVVNAWRSYNTFG